MQYDKIKLAVGVFTTVIFIVVLGSFYFLLEQKGFFDKRYTYNFSINSAESFSVGMPLKYSGFSVGVIDKIALKDDGSVRIIFSVDEENKKWIRQDTFLTIKKPLIGSAYIVVDTQLDKPMLADGSTLKIIQSDDINDMIERLDPVVKKIIKIIESIETITAHLASDDSELFEMIANLNKFSANLANSDSLLTSVTGDKESTQSLIDALNALKESMKDVNSMTSSLDGDIIQPASSSAKELELIMKDISKKLKALDGTVNSVGSYEKDLLDVKEQLSVTMEKSNEVLDKVDSLISEETSAEVELP